MTTVSIGNRAEQAACEELVRLGFDVVERNFRRKHCEIDIVARRGDELYFVEVKYRATTNWGSGLDYVDSRKVQRMARAAETWVSTHAWRGGYTLSAMEVGGPGYTIGEFIESVW